MKIITADVIHYAIQLIRRNKPSHPDAVYRAQRATAKSRGISFDLSLCEWWDIWRDHWPRRHQHRLMMCRYGDRGAYAIGNVYIGTPSDNAKDRCGNPARNPLKTNVAVR